MGRRDGVGRYSERAVFFNFFAVALSASLAALRAACLAILILGAAAFFMAAATSLALSATSSAAPLAFLMTILVTFWAVFLMSLLFRVIALLLFERSV
jgi:hypothetical protein